MAKFNWNKSAAGDWNVAANWQGGVVPNGLDADVIIDPPPAPGSPAKYPVTIGPGAADTVRSLDLGSTSTDLAINGKLTFAPGSDGAIGLPYGSTLLTLNGGTLVNAGEIYALIQTTGNALFTGANPIYVEWELQDFSGTTTIDTDSIGEYHPVQNTLFDGIYEAIGAGQSINLGGKIGGLRVDVETLTGPKATPTSNFWTDLIYDDPGSQINEWNGSAYVPIESTLKLIKDSAYVTVSNGRGYATGNALTIGSNGVFEIAGGSLTTGGLTLLAGGLLMGGVSTTGSQTTEGQVTVNGAVANNGQIVSEGPGLVFRDAITGTGAIVFNRTTVLPGFDRPPPAAAPGTLEVGSVGAGQTVTMVGNDTLILDKPGAFAGTIAGFDGSDAIRLGGGVALTGAAYSDAGNGLGTLLLKSGGVTLGSLALAGNYAGQSFQVTLGSAGNGASITVVPGAAVGTAPVAAGQLFDSAYYLAHNADVAAAGVDAYQHYLNFGWKEGRDPSALFSTSYYLSRNPDVAAAGVNPLTHFETFGFKEGRNPDAWFDTNYYLARNPDVRAAGLDPLAHYEAFGWREGRDPSLLFSNPKYLGANPDVKAAGVDPLQHYLAFGRSEGRMAFLPGGTATADPLVNAAFYDRQLGASLIPTGAPAQQQAATGYDATGWERGLNPDALFDTNYYLRQNPDVAAAHVNLLLHYEQFGWKEGRNPSAQFSTAKYLATYADVKASGTNPLLSYVTSGEAQGRTAFAV